MMNQTRGDTYGFGICKKKKKNETPSNRLIVREEALALYQK